MGTQGHAFYCTVHTQVYNEALWFTAMAAVGKEENKRHKSRKCFFF